MIKLKTQNSKRFSFSGFTLIELLIVMTIIALLASISIFALQNARKSGRDAKRKADLEVIRSGLELFKADCNRYPPSPLPNGALNGNVSYGATCLAANTYIQDVPEDPSSNQRYSYNPNGSGTTYTLCTGLEDPPAGSPPGGCTASCNPSPCTYKTISP